VKRVPLVVLALVLAACGSTADGTGIPVSSGQESVPVGTHGPTTAPLEKSKLRPPQILFRSSAGEQRAAEGSFCVDYVDPASGQGSGVCSDSAAVHPDEVTVVQPGDEVTFVFSGADIVRASGCHAEDEQGCIGSIQVRPLGCEDREVERVPLVLGPETPWTIHLETGAYELDVFGYFESSHHATGDVSGALGLLVGGGPKNHDYLGVVAVERGMHVCPFAG
jgi:predicted small secreted protein